MKDVGIGIDLSHVFVGALYGDLLGRGLHFLFLSATGVAEVAMVVVGTGGETITEMEAPVQTEIIMVGSAHALTEEHQRQTLYVLDCDLRTFVYPYSQSCMQTGDLGRLCARGAELLPLHLSSFY